MARLTIYRILGKYGLTGMERPTRYKAVGAGCDTDPFPGRRAPGWSRR